ncbi:MAG: diol dehydratase reactivase subunit alpha [Tissierellia bacterium]|nr:diol dehydratase reactivase subunit alpha [Tissierellia bacterium]
MKVLAGIDIGNATTETAIGRVKENGEVEFLGSSIVSTTGIKGTKDNINGIYKSLQTALNDSNISLEELDEIRINEAAPVIGDVAMETITETIITESTMIGHNPATPGGVGIGVGISVDLENITSMDKSEDLVVLVSKDWDFAQAAKIMSVAMESGFSIKAAIMQKDDGVLVNNRLSTTIPIVDEVTLFDKIPRDVLTAVEVAHTGKVVEVLSNPYGVATLFGLDSEETKAIVPISRALIGNRSAVVLKTPKGDVQARSIPAGVIIAYGERGQVKVDVENGAEKIMDSLEQVMPIKDIKGESGTNAGAMLEKVRHTMATLSDKNYEDIQITDLLAVDTTSPQKVQGALAGEFSMENAVGVAAMVRSDKLQMDLIANELERKLNLPVIVGGVEADMAIRGALTTPGTNTPIAILDLGAGSSDASLMKVDNEVILVHLAGAGNMVSLLIQTELGLDSFDEAEDIKKYPLAKVESMFHIRHEDGAVEFFNEMVDPSLFARTVIVKEEELVPLETNHSIEKIRIIRQEAKKKVFVTNALRALRSISPTGDIRGIEYVVLVGGSSLDFEIPQFITDALSQYGVVAGRGNIRGTQGPRNAVATGLVLT